MSSNRLELKLGLFMFVCLALAAALVTVRLHPRLGPVGAVGLFLAPLALLCLYALLVQLLVICCWCSVHSVVAFANHLHL